MIDLTLVKERFQSIKEHFNQGGEVIEVHGPHTGSNPSVFYTIETDRVYARIQCWTCDTFDSSIVNIEAETTLDRGYVIEAWKDSERHIDHFIHLVTMIRP